MSVGQEHRVIAETVAAMLLGGYLSRDLALEAMHAASLHQGDDSAETGAAVGLPAHLGQQLGDVGTVVMAVGGITCRMYTRRTAQCLHFQPAVIGEAVEPVVRCHIAGFHQCVAFERVCRLGDVGVATDVVQRKYVDHTVEHGTHLGQLVGIVGCKY